MSCIPIIDLGRNLDIKKNVRDIAQEIGDSLKNSGFIYIKNHGIDEILIERVYYHAEVFFYKPLNKKMDFDISRSPSHSGYVSLKDKGLYEDEPLNRKYEAFDISESTSLDLQQKKKGNIFNGPNLWPDSYEFKTTMNEYLNELKNLGLYICELFEIYLKLDKGSFSKKMKAPMNQLRLIHYIENSEYSNDDMNMGAHTDYELFTLLHQSKDGLETQNRDGNWVKANVIENTFILNVGDLLEVFTDGIFKSNLHRVINDGSERYSLPFFMSVDYEEQVSPMVKNMDSNFSYLPIFAGEHVVGQIKQDFSYLRVEDNILKRVNKYQNSVCEEVENVS